MDSPELPQPIKRHEAPKNDIKNGGAHKQAVQLNQKIKQSLMIYMERLLHTQVGLQHLATRLVIKIKEKCNIKI